MGCYSLISINEANELIERDNIEWFSDQRFQLTTNFANIFLLNDGRYLMIRNNMSGNCIVFDDRKCFNYYVNLDSFPIEDKSESFFRKQYIDFSSFESISSHYKDYLFDKYGTLNVDFLFDYFTRNEINEEDVIALSTLIGSIELENNNKLKWSYIKKYGDFNPYYVPHIHSSKGFTPIVDMVLNGVNSNYNNYKMIFTPPLFISNKFFKQEYVFILK